MRLISTVVKFAIARRIFRAIFSNRGSRDTPGDQPREAPPA